MTNIEVTFGGGQVIIAHINGKTIKTDQPVRRGGEGIAPEPFEMFLASIGTCAGLYVKLFCDQRGIPSENIRIIQSVEFDPEKKIPSTIKLDIKLPEGFPEKYTKAVINAAEICLVKKTINAGPLFEVVTSVS